MANVTPRTVAPVVEVPVRPHCKECGLKIRGANHKNGGDHLNRSSRK